MFLCSLPEAQHQPEQEAPAAPEACSSEASSPPADVELQLQPQKASCSEPAPPSASLLEREAARRKEQERRRRETVSVPITSWCLTVTRLFSFHTFQAEEQATH